MEVEYSYAVWLVVEVMRERGEGESGGEKEGQERERGEGESGGEKEGQERERGERERDGDRDTE